MQFDDAIKKILTTRKALEVRKQGKKWAILEKWSTKTSTKSCFLRVSGRQHEIYINILSWAV